MSPIRCVLFDNDGTLIDSEGLDAEALSLQLKEDFGVDEPVTALVAEFSGWPFREELDLLQTRHGIVIDQAFIERFRARQLLILESRLQAIPGVHDALSRITLPICVASNGPQQKIRSSLTQTGLIPFFGEHLCSAYDIDAFKPKPDLFLYAAAKMGYTPAETAVIEDSDAGVQAGLSAGMRVFRYDPHGLAAEREGVTRFTQMQQLPGLLGL